MRRGEGRRMLRWGRRGILGFDGVGLWESLYQFSRMVVCCSIERVFDLSVATFLSLYIPNVCSKITKA
jgi:hypothetical protein